MKTLGDLIRDRGSFGHVFKIAFAILVLAACGLCWVSYAHNRNLIAQTRSAVAAFTQDAAPLARETTLRDRDLNKVLPVIHQLRHLPAGFAGRDVATPPLATFGLSQRERLQAMSEDVYRVGLERLLRPRLLFRLEEQLNARKADAAFVYEALKVYLMLGGQHPPDRELIKSWMRRDWAENLYPGASNAEGRRLLEEHLSAMLALETEEPPLVELDGRLIDESQRTLARLSLSQRAYELLKSDARSSPAGDWIASQAGGQDASIVFEADQGQPLDTVRVPEFFTSSGFHDQFIAKLADLSERMKRDRWVLGAAGQIAAVGEQYDNLADKLGELYADEFVATWRSALSKLRIRKLAADRPKYIALRAVSAPMSPLRLLLESIRDETALTRARRQAGGNPAGANPTMPSAQNRTPGARIEAAFRPYHAVLLDTDGTRIDLVIGNLNDITQNLTLAIENPLLAAQANAALQAQVAQLRNNAARMPPPFSDMLRTAAAELDGEVVAATVDQLLANLRDHVTAVCQSIIGNRYPFARGGADQDVPLADFSRLFGHNGILDGFFSQSLAPHADTSGADWTWRKDTSTARALPSGLLKPFQAAAQIREAFFQYGGNVPMAVLTVYSPFMIDQGATGRLEFGRNTISIGSPGYMPTSVQWPLSPAKASISVAALGSTSVLERSGPWALFRLLEAGAMTTDARVTVATFIILGRELRLRLESKSPRNPLDLASLRDFRCPGGL